MKKLCEIVEGISPLNIIGSTDKQVATIEFDSRKVKNNSVFVAIKGTNLDGHKFIEQAIINGTTTLIVENIPKIKEDKNLTFIKVKDTKLSLATMSANFFNYPSKKLSLIGVTGTNGKTTVVTLLYRLFKKFGYKVGLLSTIENFIDTQQLPTTHTTLDVFSINKLLSKMVDVGCQFCFLEVSSHAIEQKRIEQLQFAGAVFTNISHEHLDYHKTLKNYINAKKKLFDSLPSTAFALVNADDKNGTFMLQNTKAKKYYYSLNSLQDYRAKIVERHFDSSIIEINNTQLSTYFLGKFNVYNLLSVFAVGSILKLEKDAILQNLSTLKPVKGRFEIIISTIGVRAIIDYAHTPDALKSVLLSIRELSNNGEMIITVVGAGGNRDKTKRPEIGKVAASFSDKVILTSDNPRDENPTEIISDIKEGINNKELTKVITNTDRKEAIRMACLLATKGDIILIAGKGHETYQEIKGEKKHFDDKEVLLEYINT